MLYLIAQRLGISNQTFLLKLVFRTSVSGFNQNLYLPEFLEGWKDGRMEGRDGKIPVFSNPHLHICLFAYLLILIGQRRCN